MKISGILVLRFGPLLAVGVGLSGACRGGLRLVAGTSGRPKGMRVCCAGWEVQLSCQRPGTGWRSVGWGSGQVSLTCGVL